jgi:peroxin-6
MLKAVTRQASLVDAKIAQINSSSGKNKISTAYFFDHFASKEDVAVMVTEEDFVLAERELVPSVSVKELEHYKRVRGMFEKVDEEQSQPHSQSQMTRPAGLGGKGEAGVLDGNEMERPRSNGKGKAKVVDKKGKGKSTERWDEGSESDEEVMGNGFVSKGKEKGKAVDMGFQEGREEDDEGLY